MSSKLPSFAKVPIEVVQASSRLPCREFRVLVALYAFANQQGQCWPSRQWLTVLTAISPDHISRVTTSLQKAGWLKKVGNGGRSKSVRYQLYLPQKWKAPLKLEDGTHRGTLTKDRNPAPESRVSKQKQCQERQLNSADQGRGIEQTREQITISTASAAAAGTESALLASAGSRNTHDYYLTRQDKASGYKARPYNILSFFGRSSTTARARRRRPMPGIGLNL